MRNLNEPDTAEFAGRASSMDGDRPPPFSSLVRVDLAGLSHPGKVRTNNEDHFFIGRFGRFFEPLQSNLPPDEMPERSEEVGYGMVVADGMGGHRAGEVASRLAIVTFINRALHTPDWILRLDDEMFAKEVQFRATERLGQVKEILAEKAQADPRLHGFGTTITLAVSLGRDLMVVHVGDSPVYLFRREKLHRLTRDHTLAQALADRGLIAQREVAVHRLRHVLTRVLGDQEREVEPDVQQFLLEEGDCLLLCTDGLSEMLKDEAIAGILGAGRSAEETCQQLVAAALEAGGKDNVSVVVARYQFPAAS
jgi:protein phosphatase